MSILILANPEDPHTLKWVKGVASRNIRIVLFGLNAFDHALYIDFQHVTCYDGGLPRSFIKSSLGGVKKVKYLGVLRRLQKIIQKEKPDLIHAHYASSYGILGALLNRKPFFLSVWGGDVYVFPKKSWIHKQMFRFVLKRATRIFSTSKTMKQEIQHYTSRTIHVIPFGIPLDQFQPTQKTSATDTLTIGTVKKLHPVYGIDTLIRAFYELQEHVSDTRVLLRIVGDGPVRKELEQLVHELQLEQRVQFDGEVHPDEVPGILQEMDIFSTLSRVESFGVSVIEASAIGLPVVVSDTGGLPEVVRDGKTGFVVEQGNSQKAADALLKLVMDGELRKQMGQNGRAWVESKYDWEKNLGQMIEHYEEALQ